MERAPPPSLDAASQMVSLSLVCLDRVEDAKDYIRGDLL